LPFYSGYRDTNTKKVVFTTVYRELADSLEEVPGVPAVRLGDPLATDVYLLKAGDGSDSAQVDIEDLGIVLSLSEITSLSLYDDAIYKWFQTRAPGGGPAPAKSG
jgi:hypothetical protein